MNNIYLSPREAYHLIFECSSEHLKEANSQDNCGICHDLYSKLSGIAHEYTNERLREGK